MKGVTEFVILSSPQVADYLASVRGKLRRYLAVAFPEFDFSLANQAENDGLDFVVVPVMGVVNGDEVQEMREVDPMVLERIRLALEAFDPFAETESLH